MTWGGCRERSQGIPFGVLLVSSGVGPIELVGGRQLIKILLSGLSVGVGLKGNHSAPFVVS